MTINQNFSPIPQIYTTHRTLSFRPKRISGKVLSFPGKLTLCAKFEQKWFCWDFEVLPPDYGIINQNFSPSPQIYRQYPTISIKKSFWKISQFSRKAYIVCKIWTKMVFVRILSVTPDYLTVNQTFTPIPLSYIPKTTILITKNLLKISQFHRKIYIVCQISTR